MKTAKDVLNEISKEISNTEDFISRSEALIKNRRIVKARIDSCDVNGRNEKYYPMTSITHSLVLDLLKEQATKDLEVAKKHLADLSDPLKIAMRIELETKEI